MAEIYSSKIIQIMQLVNVMCSVNFKHVKSIFTCCDNNYTRKIGQFCMLIQSWHNFKSSQGWCQSFSGVGAI